MSRADEIFQPALVGKKIPILTLDNKWHKLFTQREYTSEIKRMENDLNTLLKRQAKLKEECKELKKLKKKMMEEIVVLADAIEKASSKKLEKEMEEHRRTVNECNDKIDSCEEELVELPRQISQANNQLMVATMEVCYHKLQKNTAELEEINDWISNIRRELKKKVVRKQEKEAMINQLYAYMHDIFGADVIELFDMKYNPEEKNKKNQGSAKKDGEPGTEKKEENENALKS